MDLFDFNPYIYRDNNSDSNYSNYNYGDDGPDIIPLYDGSPKPPIYKAVGVAFILILLSSFAKTKT
jgi:hypothetical protein